MLVGIHTCSELKNVIVPRNPRGAIPMTVYGRASSISGFPMMPGSEPNLLAHSSVTKNSHIVAIGLGVFIGHKKTSMNRSYSENVEIVGADQFALQLTRFATPPLQVRVIGINAARSVNTWLSRR